MSKKPPDVKVWWNGSAIGSMEVEKAVEYVEQNLPLLKSGETIELEVVRKDVMKDG